MGGNSYGTLFKITTFGESHGKSLGVIIDGVPPGIELDTAAIQHEMDRRKPGQSDVTSPREESDTILIQSGMFEGKTTGTALMMMLNNKDQNSKDYSEIMNKYRPGHADFTYQTKYGIRDYRGGGRSSGRETAARVAAGAVAKQILNSFDIKTVAFTRSIGGVTGNNVDYNVIEENPVRSADKDAADEMMNLILLAQEEGDSVGGSVECHISGVPAGLGEPVFDKLDGELAKAMLSLGTVKGIEFGRGFGVCLEKGSTNNDQRDKKGYHSNHAGGIEGGISNGNEIVFRIAVKPTPSISIEQSSIELSGKNCKVITKGRHDPCICPRIVPVVESMANIVLLDFLLRQKVYLFLK